MNPENAITWLSAVREFASIVSEYRMAFFLIATLIVLIGVPEIGPKDRPWIRSRKGFLDAYRERSEVFAAIRDEMREHSKKTDLHTRVLLVIASHLGIDIAKIVEGLASSDPVPLSTTGKDLQNPAPNSRRKPLGNNK